MDNPLNPSRRLYQRILQGNRPSEQQISDTITASNELRNLLRHPGWKRVDKWIAIQEEGAKQFMQTDVDRFSVFTLLTFFNSYIRYLFFLMEHRAYRKVRTYITVTIQKGEAYARQRARKSGVDSSSK